MTTEQGLALAALISAIAYAIHVLSNARAKAMVIDAENDDMQTRINSQAFADLRVDVVTLRNEVLELRTEILTLNNANNLQNIENRRLQFQLETTLKQLSERTAEIAELKTILEDVRKQLVDFMTKAMAQGIQPEAKDVRLLEETKADIENTKEQKNKRIKQNEI